MKICGIYLIENKVTGRAYVGKSIDILGRWEQHLDAARLHKQDYEFYQDLEQVENFSFTILERCSRDELSEKEHFYIEKLKAKEFGYNQVSAIDKRKIEAEMLDKRIYDAIYLLETSLLSYREIAERTDLTEVIIANINRCKSHTEYHSYKKNIRLECGKKQYADIGENNPRSKLTESEVLQIIELLKTTNLTAEQIGQRFGVSKSAINNINTQKNWKHLSQEFKCNIRKEYKNYQKRELELDEDKFN